jgi:hypothetical protein
MVTSKVSSFSLDSTFFMTSPRVTKDCFVLPTRAEGEESFGLLSPIAAQNLFDGARQIVVFQTLEDSAKVMERHLARFQKGLLRRSLIGPVIGRSACHTPHGEELQCAPLPIDFGDRFVSIVFLQQKCLKMDSDINARL